MIEVKLKEKIYSVLSFLFIISIFFHKFQLFDKFVYIKISELIFPILFIVYVIFDGKKLFKQFDKIDVVVLFWPVLNILQFYLTQII